jgi:hypothetical protein
MLKMCVKYVTSVMYILKSRVMYVKILHHGGYICSFLLFVWLFFFTYALLAVVYVSHGKDRFFNTPRL